MLFLLFHLDGGCYALDSASINRVLPLLAIRTIPRAPVAVAGVIVFEGVTVPVIDLSELALGRPAAQRLSTRIVLVDHVDVRGNCHLLGLIAEHATGTFSVEASAFKPSGVSTAEARYLGDVASGPSGLIQRVEVGELVTPAIAMLLFEAGSEV